MPLHTPEVGCARGRGAILDCRRPNARVCGGGWTVTAQWAWGGGNPTPPRAPNNGCRRPSTCSRARRGVGGRRGASSPHLAPSGAGHVTRKLRPSCSLAGASSSRVTLPTPASVMFLAIWGGEHGPRGGGAGLGGWGGWLHQRSDGAAATRPGAPRGRAGPAAGPYLCSQLAKADDDDARRRESARAQQQRRCVV